MPSGFRMRQAQAAMLRVRPLLHVPDGWFCHGASSTAALIQTVQRHVHVSTLSWSVLHTWRTATGEGHRYRRFDTGQVDELVAAANAELEADVGQLERDPPVIQHSTPVDCPRGLGSE